MVLKAAKSPPKPHTPRLGRLLRTLVGQCSMNTDVVPPLAANMNAAFKKVRGAIEGSNNPAVGDLIASRIVELAKDGVYDIEELSSRTLSSLKPEGYGFSRGTD
jgi:hypothetical protein